MSILEKDLWINCGNRNDAHFESLGYVIPRYTDSKGRIMVKKGTKILVKTNDLPEDSNIKVTKVCDMENCNNITLNKPYGVILREREKTDGRDRCKTCGQIYSRSVFRKNISYERSFEYFAMNNSLENLLQEFSEKNAHKPNEIFYGSRVKFLWVCSACKSEYEMSPSDRQSRKKCPFCSARKVNHTNCLWNTHPEVASLLKHPNRGYEITYGNNKKERFVCNNCGHEQRRIVQNVVNQGWSCEKCSDGISYPEKFLMNVLDQLGINYETQKTFKWSGKKRYDFYCKELDNLIIEVHGEQHYTERGRGRTLKEEQDNDILKHKLAVDNEIKNYISLECRVSNKDYIVNSITNSKLSKIIDLGKIDWENCHRFATNSTLLKTACDLWNSGIKSTLEISNVMKIHRTTVTSYLKRGNELEWCNYNPKEQLSQVGKVVSIINKRKVIQYSKDGELIKVWDSITEASNCLKISRGNICAVCKEERNLAGKYKWSYAK